jgi:hypothetical protein
VGVKPGKVLPGRSWMSGQNELKGGSSNKGPGRK